MVMITLMLVLLKGNSNDDIDDSILHGNCDYDFDDGTITSMMSMTIMTTAFSGGGCMGRCLRMQMLHPAQCNSLC